MGKMKELLFDLRGYNISGKVLIQLSTGQKREFFIEPVYITQEKFTHNAIKRAISIIVDSPLISSANVINASVDIDRVHGLFYYKYNRTIELDFLQCQDICIIYKNKEDEQ